MVFDPFLIHDLSSVTGLLIGAFGTGYAAGWLFYVFRRLMLLIFT